MRLQQNLQDRMWKKAFLGGLILVLISGETKAQKLSDTISIQEVQVYGKRKIEEAAMLVTHIDTLALQMMKTQTVSELLTSYSPVFIKSYGRGSTATASFRGTAPSHTQVYWNGIKLNSPMRGDVDFSLFPVYFIDDISLQHGGSSLQSGSGALGGSVLINNKADWSDRLSVRYVQTLESFGTYKEYLNLGFGNGRLQFKTRLFSDRSKNEFPYFNYGVLPMHESVQQNAGYSKLGLLQEAYFRIKKQSFSAKIWAYQSERDLPQLMSFEGDVRKETQDDRNFRAVISWKYVSEKSRLEWVSGLNHNELNYFRSSTESGFVNFDSRSLENSYTNQITFDWKPQELLSLNWALNSSYDVVSVFDRAQQLGYDQDQLSFSLLNSVHFQPVPKVLLSFLFRSDLYDSRLIGFIPSLGMEFFANAKEKSSLKLNLARNYHQPGLNDLYWLPGGNPNLKPEDGYTGDVSFAYSGHDEKSSLSMQITGFASVTDNWIVWQPSANGAYYWEANNLRKVFARGAEIQVSAHRKLTNSLTFDLKGNYSHSATSNVDAVPSVDESRGKQLIYIPKDKANLFAKADISAFYLKINAPFTGKRYTSSNNVESDYEKVLNPYWLVNLTLGRRLIFKTIQADVSLNIENILNTDYMAILWRPMPGRYYSFTVQFNYRK
ncbi:MAG: TonB-dependent receptor plug domain-containing protein [Prolixibacteraceae bacterium]